MERAQKSRTHSAAGEARLPEERHKGKIVNDPSPHPTEDAGSDRITMLQQLNRALKHKLPGKALQTGQAQR